MKVHNQQQRHGRIKAEHFVQLWLEACENRQPISWIANILRVSDQTVHRLASNLRSNGVDLPRIRQPFVEPVKVDRLNELIKKQLGL
jgi:hypothetical protein